MSTLTVGLNINRFTDPAKAVIRRSRHTANVHRSRGIGTDDLLATLAGSKTKIGEALSTNGVTYGQVLSCTRFYSEDGWADRELNESELGSNFDGGARNALSQAIIGAEMRNEDKATEIDLLNVLIGYSSNNFASYKVLQRLGKTSGPIFRSLSERLNSSTDTEQVVEKLLAHVT